MEPRDEIYKIDRSEESVTKTEPLSQVTKIVYLQPFPEMKTKEEYDKFIKHRFGQKIYFNGFALTRDDRGKTYDDYSKDFNELLSFIEEQKKQFKASFNKVGQQVEIKVYTLPTNQEELDKLHAVFSDLKASDILLVSAHGNPNVIGIAAVSMNAQQIDHALFARIGLPNPSPFVVVWACNSATQDKKKPTATLIDDLQQAMQQRGMESANVTGVTGYLNTALPPKEDEKQKGRKVTEYKAPKEIVKATDKVKKRYPQPGSPLTYYKPRKKEEYLRHVGTPESSSKIKDLDRRMSMGTQLREASEARAEVIREREMAKKKVEVQKKQVQPPVEIVVEQAPKKPAAKVVKKSVQTENKNTVEPEKAEPVQNTVQVEANTNQAPRRDTRSQPTTRPKKTRVPAPVVQNETEVSAENTKQQKPVIELRRSARLQGKPPANDPVQVEAPVVNDQPPKKKTQPRRTVAASSRLFPSNPPSNDATVTGPGSGVNNTQNTQNTNPQKKSTGMTLRSRKATNQ